MDDTEIAELQEKEIEQLNNDGLDVEEIYELDALISEGINAKVSLTFTYPNTDKKVGVMIRPLSTGEYRTAIQKAQKLHKVFFYELMKIGLYDSNGNPFPVDILEQLPFGVVTYIAGSINKISGMDLLNTEMSGGDMDKIVDTMMGF